ncbi:MAG: Rne/Rng family ribonuclease [Bryobacteraceae bacterium]
MSKEMVISANRHETKVAILEDDLLVETYFQRSNEYSLAGSIHKGRVTRVLPGMQSAFVDLGLERDTFLYVSDFLEEHEDFDKITGDERPVRSESRGENRGESRSEQRGGRGDRRDRRDGRRDRDQSGPRPEREGQPAPVAAQADGEAVPAVEGDTTPLVEGEAPTVETSAALVAEGAAPQQQDRGERQNRDGRRGRRRRRRGGGRGFPESKYVGDEPQTHEGAKADAADVDDAEGSDEGVADKLPPIVLPGESLAKYRHAQPSSDSQAERRKVSAAAEPVVGDDAEADEEIADEVIENAYDEPIHYPPENALPDAPVHDFLPSALQEDDDAVLEHPDAEAAQEAAEAAQEAAEAALDARDAVEEATDADSESADEAGEEEVAVSSMLDDDEDHDIQAMILGDVEGIEIEPLEGDEAAEESGEASAEGEVAAEGAESGSASVRQRGDRLPHRVSRRRRRGRGDRGDRGDNRGDRGDRGPAPEARGPEAKPEGREGRDGREGRQERTISRPNTNQPSIADLLKEGQEIIVQIAKEPLGQKGARITSHIALPGRYVVYMPTLEHMGVSRKISSDEERLRLKRVLQAQRPGPVGGYITRTAAEGRTEEEIAADMQFLYNLWQDMRTKAEKKPAPMLLHHDLDIVQRLLRDQLGDAFKAIWIDNEEMYESVVRFVERFQPTLVGKVKLYTRDAPIFDAFNITNELEKALRPKVWLKSGGFIVINQTEALVAIDVNTGKYVGKTNRLEDTIVKTNTEAIKEIVRQIRLRDLGGIIVIDFIDMDERKNRQKVMQALEEAMRVDRAPYKILQFNDFGLVAITRKRVKQSLERTLCSPCPQCDGAGYVKSTQTVVSEILTEARKMAKTVEGKDVVLRVHPEVAKVLKSHQNKYLEELEELLRRPVLIKSDPQLHQEKFDLA